MSVGFQCSSASRKFLNHSEALGRVCPRPRFSALQRAENSSMERKSVVGARSEFQCSSASRKFLNHRRQIHNRAGDQPSFSALQRAENSSIGSKSAFALNPMPFQCSSASRKFLNLTFTARLPRRLRRFSALQRAENSSIVRHPLPPIPTARFQCSSASRKFLNSAQSAGRVRGGKVSVLFSEPKIPQFAPAIAAAARIACFSALQRAENSSMVLPNTTSNPSTSRFSALQRAENSSIAGVVERPAVPRGFQCSSASRKFLN